MMNKDKLVINLSNKDKRLLRQIYYSHKYGILIYILLAIPILHLLYIIIQSIIIDDALYFHKGLSYLIAMLLSVSTLRYLRVFYKILITIEPSIFNEAVTKRNLQNGYSHEVKAKR